MKKLVFMFVAMAAISFASCGGEKAGANADSAAVDSNKTEATAVEEAPAPAPAAEDSTNQDSIK